MFIIYKGHISFCEKFVDILEKFKKDWALNKNCIAEKDDFEVFRLHFLTFNDL